MQLKSNGFSDGERIPAESALCVADPESHVTFSANRNPHLEWEEVPEGTRSQALICVDVTVPTSGEDVNQEGREVPPDLPRTDFFHWVVANLPADLRSIAAGEFATGVVPGGRDAASGLHGSAQGVNDYTGWFAGDPSMAGDWYGYDGPCPPWNDSLIHEYHFIVYALDVASLNLSGPFTGHDLRSAMEGHILAEASLMGTYTLNPRLGA